MNNQKISLRHILLYIGTLLLSVIVMLLAFDGGTRLLKFSDSLTATKFIVGIWVAVVLILAIYIVKYWREAIKEPSRNNTLKFLLISIISGILIGALSSVLFNIGTFNF